MNPAPGSSLSQLRAKTDRQLVILVRRELKRCLTFANADRSQDAKRSLAAAKTLLALSGISGKDRASLEQELDDASQALPRCVSAA